MAMEGGGCRFNWKRLRKGEVVYTGVAWREASLPGKFKVMPVISPIFTGNFVLPASSVLPVNDTATVGVEAMPTCLCSP